ncbi:MAG: hypothetical protein AAF433_00320 [Bacteroidota bacterium]
MRFLFFGLLPSLLLMTCQESTPVSTLQGADATNFQIDIQDQATFDQLVKDGHFRCQDCSARFVEVEGLPAMEITSQLQFCDAYFDLEGLFGHTYDLSQARYLSYALYVPASSWIGTVNHNYQDADGYTAGCGRPTNSFIDYKGQWVRYLIDLQAQQRDEGCETWNGEVDPLDAVQSFSINPYNGNLTVPSVLFVNDIRLSDQHPNLDFTPRFMPDLNLPNQTYLIDFEDEAHLRRVVANRGYEAKNHRLINDAYGKAGRSIVSTGTGTSLNFFLPKIQYFTGQPVDFTQVDSIYFSYYLTEDSGDVPSSQLFVVSEEWADILMDTSFYGPFEKGSWQRLSFALDDLGLFQVRGEELVLPQVYEMRVDLKPDTTATKVEMYFDDFGWR